MSLILRGRGQRNRLAHERQDCDDTAYPASSIAMALSYILDDYDLEGFLQVAAAFGTAGFGYVVTPNVDHLIRFHDDPGFRALYAEAAYVLLDSRFLSHLFRVTKGLHVRVCTGS